MTEPITPADDAPVADNAPVTPDVDAPVADTDEATTATEVDADEIRKLKKEAQQQRAARRAAEAEAKTLREAEEARKLAELSEADQAKAKAEAAEARAAELEAKLRATTVEAELRSAARAANFADEADALQLATSITLDDDGRPVGVTEAVAALLASRPHYAAKPGNPRLDANNGGRGAAPDLTPQQQTQNLWARPASQSIWPVIPTK